MFELVVSTKDSKVSLSKSWGRRPSSSLHRLCIVVEGGKGRQSVFGRPKPLKLEMSTLTRFETMICVVAVNVVFYRRKMRKSGCARW